MCSVTVRALFSEPYFVFLLTKVSRWYYIIGKIVLLSKRGILGHIPKKHFGQNFLTVPYYTEKITQSVPAVAGDVVVEIGPGKGALTKHLVDLGFDLHLIEMDGDVAVHLKEALGDALYTLHMGDAKKFPYESLGDGYHAVGNLPYNVASHIIKAILLTAPLVRSVTFMVQKEVAERICATSKGKDRGFLTVMCGYFGDPKKLFDVPPGAFFPPPKITSSVFRIELDPLKFNRIDKDKWLSFFGFVTAGFSQRRKKLATSLSSSVGSKSGVAELLQLVGIGENARAEELSVDQWVELFLAQK